MTTLRHVADIERDLGIELIGTETEKQEFGEAPYMFGDDLRFHTRYFAVTAFNATGFRLHQNGGIISGNFAEPIEVVTVETDAGGDILDTSFDEANVARAVLAKLGPIPDMEGGLRAAAGV